MRLQEVAMSWYHVVTVGLLLVCLGIGCTSSEVDSGGDSGPDDGDSGPDDSDSEAGDPDTQYGPGP